MSQTVVAPVPGAPAPSIFDADDVVVDVRPDDGPAAARVEVWFREYALTGDPRIRERIIMSYLGMADRLAERFRSSRGVAMDDLRQTARIGLVKAVDRYEPDRANPFVPYAVVSIVGEIKRQLRDTSWRLRVPRSAKELSLKLCKALDEMPQVIGRSPTVPELAQCLGVGEDAVLEAIDVAQTRVSPSLDQPVGEDGQMALGDLLVDNRPCEEIEDLVLLPELIKSLPERERQIVVLRYFHELTQDEIAARVGVSQMHISRLLRRALERMRAQLLVA